MEEMKKAGVQRATFGVGAADHMRAVEHLSGLRTKALSEAYGKIAKGFHLTNKSDYRFVSQCLILFEDELVGLYL